LVGAILRGEFTEIKEGDEVRLTGTIMFVSVMVRISAWFVSQHGSYQGTALAVP
jgi:hypothetical protein